MNSARPFSSFCPVLAGFALLLSSLLPARAETPFRPPAVPLLVNDPYLSVWSEADHLTDDVTRHWTQHEFPLVSLIRIDDKSYRLMGIEPGGDPAFPQTSVQVTPTRSIYQFDDGHVHATLTFMTAMLPGDLDVLARPLSYLAWEVRSVDGASHHVALYDSTSALLSVNTPHEGVTWARQTTGDLAVLKVGAARQTLLQPEGDDTRINWGYLYAAAPSAQAAGAIGSSGDLIWAFDQQGRLPAQDDTRMPRSAGDDEPVLAFAFDLGNVGKEAVSRHLIVAYDELSQIRFAGRELPPYWRRQGATPETLLQSAEKDYASLTERCAAFDSDLTADLTRVGGARYAQLCALAYRQCLAGCGLAADAAGKPLLFTKENSSNGDIATVDVIYPMVPMLLALSPVLAKASVVPVLAYAASSRWKFPNAPHDLGHYPVATASGAAGEAMPVEESANLILICDAIAKADGNADFSGPWWPQLTQWAFYLEQYGLDPEEQLCTDDFMGHLAHNSNLSVKAILALAAYGDLCGMRGDAANAKRYADLARADAVHWIQSSADGDHSNLAFDKPGTWSQKYNLAWDRILGLNVFPPEAARKEVAHSRAVMQKYGVPLDSRTLEAKTDWAVWNASLAESQGDFEALTTPIYEFFNATDTRLPFADLYPTNKLKGSGFRARPVIGGIFIEMMTDPALWKKWTAAADGNHITGWAPFPAS